MDQRKLFGFDGEEQAARFYEHRGFKVIARNWTCAFGELDLIVEKEGSLVCVEVKTRRTILGGFPEEAVNRRKIGHLKRWGASWSCRHPSRLVPSGRSGRSPAQASL